MTNKSDIFADDWSDNDQLIERLKNETKVLKDPKLEQALRSVDRKDFLREGYTVEAYEDYAVPIGEEQTISQPTTVVYMLDLLELSEGQRVLDVGTGSGWTTALIAEIVGEGGEVYGVEINKDLAKFGQQNLEKYIKKQKWENIEIRHADAGDDVQPEAPFDRILVSAATQGDVPEILLKQLRDGGIIVIPVNDTLVKISKKDEELEREEHPGFHFVPFQ